MADVIRAGMIGCDTSHCGSFAKLFHDEKDPKHVPGVRVVAAYPSFSPDVKSSADRINDFKKQLAEQWNVKMTASIAEMLEQVDAVMITSVDGRRHLKELQAVAGADKPVFIDKPFSASLADAKAMVKLIKQHKIPCFGGSSLRFDSSIAKLRSDPGECGKILGCDAFSPASLEKTNPGLFWYGVHGVEILYAIMGQGCKEVHCSSTPDGDLAVGVWSDGRLGTMRGIRKGHGGYGAMFLCEKKNAQLVQASGDFYVGQAKAVAEFFKTRRPPVAIEETLEICAFMDAALRSSEKGGMEMNIDL